MTRNRKISAFVAAIAIAGVAAFLFSSRASTPSPNDRSTTIAIERQLRDGDLVLRMGRGLWSKVFRDTSPHDRRYSHAGILVANGRGDGFNVVHAAADDLSGIGCVRSEPLARFLDDAETWGIYRNDRTPHMDVAACVKEFLGRPFDTSFDLTDDSTIYCTELVFLCFNKLCGPETIATEIRDGRKIVTPENCYAPSAGWKLVASSADQDGDTKISLPGAALALRSTE